MNPTTQTDGNNCNCGPTPRNGCSEGDHNGCTELSCYAGDVNATLALGFDSLKLDGCGGQRDIQLWSEMFNHSIRAWNEYHPTQKRLPMMIENCHTGMETKPPTGQGPLDWGSKGITPHYDDKGELWCPFHMYRTGGDNRPTWGSVLSHLNRTVAFAEANLSVPGCWAYPDSESQPCQFSTLRSVSLTNCNQLLAVLEVGVTNAQLPLPGKK